LKVGDWVEIRSEEEILGTLDSNGRLDHLPFMPEMLMFASKRFRVVARADKTCDTITKTGGRRMLNTVHLDTRCDGSAHGGCQAACRLFWNEAWLKRVDAPAESLSAPSSHGGAPTCSLVQLTRAACVETAGGELRYHCQATELLEATSPLNWWDVRQYWRDWRSGNVKISRLLRVLAVAVFNAIERWRGGGLEVPRMPQPTLDKTPTASLDLQPGEFVRVKSVEEICKTLDVNSKNRGMWFDAEMVRYCGGTYQVTQQVRRIIDERTGRMLNFRNASVMLRGVVCQSEYSRRRLFCPRQIPSYWREIWLERVSPMELSTSPRGQTPTCAHLERGSCTPLTAAARDDTMRSVLP
jgi:hypothetical protein